MRRFLAYGYRVVEATDTSAERLEIVPEQAVVVRRVFHEFARGVSCQRIAHALNEEHVPGPQGTWAVSGLYGSPSKGTGILNNELYIGRVVWNRSRWTRAANGRRVRKERPESEWQIEEHPELRIVSDVDWRRVRQRMPTVGVRKKRAPRNVTLLGGLLKCGLCGGSIVALSSEQYGCANFRDRGPAVCVGIQAERSQVDNLVLNYIRKSVLTPENVARIEEDTHRRVEELRRKLQLEERRRETRSQELREQANNLVNTLGQTGPSPTIVQKLHTVEDELVELSKPIEVPSYDPERVSRVVQAGLLNLQHTLYDHIDLARASLKSLLREVTLTRQDGTRYLELHAGFGPNGLLFNERIELP